MKLLQTILRFPLAPEVLALLEKIDSIDSIDLLDDILSIPFINKKCLIL